MMRVILGVFSVIFVFILPWWIVFLFALALLFYFDNFWEIILISLLADVLYGSMDFWGYPYPITLIAIIVFLIVKKFKRNLVGY